MYHFAEKYQDIQVDNGVGGESPGVGTKQTFEDAFNSATNSLLHGEKNRTKKQIKHLQVICIVLAHCSIEAQLCVLKLGGL